MTAVTPSLTKRPPGRPRAGSRPAACPAGHSGDIYLHGQRKRPDGIYARSRFRCLPSDGSPSHTFALAKRTPTHRHPDERSCPTCEHEAGRADGATAVPFYTFSVAEIARALVLVGQGISMREASQRIRFEADRYQADRSGRRTASRQNALSADYLDHYAQAVIRRFTPPRWARILTLDSQPLDMRAYGADALGYKPERRGGAVLVAAGKDEPRQRARTWHVGLAGDETEASWASFLGEIDPAGAGPLWVVMDGSKAIANAVEARWPDAIRYPCEYHLKENATKHALDEGLLAQVPELVGLIEECLYSVAKWEALAAVVAPIGPSKLFEWLIRSERVRQMVLARWAFPGFPRGNGPAERTAIAIRAAIGDRKRNFRNAGRLRRVVQLVGIELAEQADAGRYTRALRDAITKDNWVRRRVWDLGQDDRRDLCSMSELIVSGWQRADAAAADAMTSAVSASVMSKVSEASVARLAAGHTPLVATIAPGRSVASVKVRGMMVADFPNLVAEWDWERNVGDPATVPAGRGEKVWWICEHGHRWRAEISMRTVRQTRCRECHRQWATETTSLAAVRPDLLPEWDRERNLPRTPERTLATSRVVAWWVCCDRPDIHPAYQMSPFARGRHELGCLVCRRVART